MTHHEVVLIAGDGIGPEVTAAVGRVMDAAGAPIVWRPHLAGMAAIDKGLDALPDETIDAIRACGVALKGPCTTPVGGGFRSINV
jgi:isocitrate dehydrogenase (NAD+)